MNWLRERKQQQLGLILIIFMVLTLACSLPFIGEDEPGSSQTPAAEGTASPGSGEGALRCEQAGYPCSYAEASEGALERGFALMDTAEDVFEKEGNAIAVAERLREEGDISEMYYDERGVWYRVEGGPPMIFLHPDAFQAEGQTSSAAPRGPAAPKVRLRPYLPEPDGPVGENPPGEQARKKALFVAPFAWDFGTDVIESARPILTERRDYQCGDCVQFLAEESNPMDQVSPDNPQAGPSLEQFQGWGEFDLIHVLAHGYQFCPGSSVSSSGNPVVSGDRETFPENTEGIVEGAEVSEGECATFIQTGHFEAEEHIAENPSSTPGTAWAYKPGQETWMEVVTTDFFRTEYPNGLDDKIIIFTSCQGLKDDSLAQALLGENTAVFGWTDYVKESRGERVAVRLINELVKNGLRSSVALQKTTESSGHTEHADDWYGAQLVMEKSENGDPRAREVITWMHPIYREKLKSIGHTPVEGIPGDGSPEEMLILLQIDGVDADQNPADFTAHVKIAGQEIQTDIKPTRKISEYSHWAQAEIEFPGDSNSIPEGEIEAWVDLPEGGDTRHVLEEVQFADCGWRATYSGDRSGSVAGTIAIDTKNAAGVDMEGMKDALGSRLPQTGLPGMSDLESAASGPRAFLLGDEGGTPFITVADGGAGALAIEMPLAFAGDAVQYSLSRDDGTVVQGTVNGTMRRGTMEGGEETINVQAEFEWHKGSLCSFQIISQIIENGAADGALEGGG